MSCRVALQWDYRSRTLLRYGGSNTFASTTHHPKIKSPRGKAWPSDLSARPPIPCSPRAPSWEEPHGGKRRVGGGAVPFRSACQRLIIMREVKQTASGLRRCNVNADGSIGTENTPGLPIPIETRRQNLTPSLNQTQAVAPSEV